MEENTFKAAYNALNEKQKEAVDAIEGPVMVIAGPGTGKTQILTLRIANILQKTDAQPESILALTFTESGARAMRERLRSYIGAAAYRVPIHTFHEFGAGLIREYPDAYERVVGGRPATDIDRIEVIETIIESSDVRTLRPMGNPLFYVPSIGNALATMKQEYIRPDDLAVIIEKQEKELSLIPKIHEKGAHKGKVRSEYQKKEKLLERNRELLLVYRAYEALLGEKKLFDFEDMIVETVRALEADEAMLRDLQESYQYLLADEHQDVNGSQNRILELLSSYHERPNLFVVGDEKQAIYRFQGASLENFLYFEEVYPNTKTIALTQNYRSAQVILDAAQSLITVESGPQKDLRIPLTAVTQKKGVAEMRTYSHQAVEDEEVVQRSAECIENGVPPNEIAVIVRTNREVQTFAALFRKKGIAVRASADSDILGHPITVAVRGLIDAVVAPEDERALVEVLHGSYWGLNATDLVKVLSQRNYSRTVASVIEDRELLTSIGVAEPEQVLRISTLLKEARNREITEAPHRVLEYIFNESGFLDYVMKNDALEGTRVLRRLYDEVEELVKREGKSTLRAVCSLIQLRQLHNLPLSAPYITTSEEAVNVLTAHKAKGLEFEHVFVPHLSDSLWGGRKRATYFDIPLTRHLSGADFGPLDDERRLLYVALTRAKVGLSVSYAKTNTEGKNLLPSRLLEDIEPELLTEVDTKSAEDSFDYGAALKKEPEKALLDTALLKTLFIERGLSATALNNYLKSPWEYFYKNVIRVPEIQPLYLQKGTALHAVLMHITAFNREQGALPNATKIKTYLERELAQLPITKEEYVRLHEEGFAMLLTYLEHIKPTLTRRTREEMRFEVTLDTRNDELPHIKLTGMLDRLDFNEAGEVVQVVDYKTGKPKTRNFIEGKTKGSPGDYKRQLVFYALILSLFENESYACRESVLSFIEADTQGRIHEEAYAITDEEIDELREEIIRVSLEIAQGTFLSLPCDPETTDYCHLAIRLQGDV